MKVRPAAGRMTRSAAGNEGAAIVVTAMEMQPAVHARKGHESCDEPETECADGDELGTDATHSRTHPGC